MWSYISTFPYVYLVCPEKTLLLRTEVSGKRLCHASKYLCDQRRKRNKIRQIGAFVMEIVKVGVVSRYTYLLTLIAAGSRADVLLVCSTVCCDSG
jgi:hypothetical protein